ncbi:MAG: hypothetical protein M1828_002804 [Chrysothrix sp. TS-e1954]|nr:MAG: hypothetical protein M1828_002804 [Chrysothrix sp. TS-e1954]
MPHHCHDEHCSHDHSDDLTPALQNHLYAQIDFASVRTLNESAPSSGRKILEKTWQDRLSPTPELVSSADEQLIMHVPFTGQVRLHSIHIRTSPSASAPKTLRIFANNDDLDFSTAEEARPTQEVELALTSEVQDIPVKRQLFNSTRCLALFFVDNWSAGEEDETRLSYVGFKGDFLKLNKEAVNVLYESAARPSDHKVEGVEELGAKQGF